MSLFTVGPRDGAASPGEEDLLRDLEERVAQVDAVEERDPAARWTPEQIAKRRALLAELESAGLFEPAHIEAMEEWLRHWSLPRLLGYVRAASELREYYRSPERARYVVFAGVPPVVGGPISVDWFRYGTATPPEAPPFAWLGFFEHLVANAELTSALAGETTFHQDGAWYRIRWRREDGSTPALVEARRLDAGFGSEM